MSDKQIKIRLPFNLDKEFSDEQREIIESIYQCIKNKNLRDVKLALEALNYNLDSYSFISDNTSSKLN